MKREIVIVFIGLIVQVNQPHSLLNTAALPSGGTMHPHVAQLEIPFDMIVEPDRSLTRTPRGYAVIDLEGVHVTVEGTNGWFSRMSGALEDSLPPLRKLNKGCKLRQEVIDRTPTEDLYSFVDFRGGRRTVDTYLSRQLQFRPGNVWSGCASCAVAYKANLRESVVTLKLEDKKGTREIRVRPGAEIFVKNTPAQKMENHFHLLYGVYEGCKTTNVTATLSTPCERAPQCLEERGDGPTAPGADCTGGNG